jgi:hypothetical protein
MRLPLERSITLKRFREHYSHIEAGELADQVTNASKKPINSSSSSE